MKYALLLSVLVVGIAVPVAAQSARAFERANEHARFKRDSAPVAVAAPVSVPEPGTIALLLTGIASYGLLAFKLRKV